MARFLSTAAFLVVATVLFAPSLQARSNDSRKMSKSQGSHEGAASGSYKIGFDPDGTLPWPKRPKAIAKAGSKHHEEDKQDDADFWAAFLDHTVSNSLSEEATTRAPTPKPTKSSTTPSTPNPSRNPWPKSSPSPPTRGPTPWPYMQPGPQPSLRPTSRPTSKPTSVPSGMPSEEPSQSPLADVCAVEVRQSELCADLLAAYRICHRLQSLNCCFLTIGDHSLIHSIAL
jgi:hypothetical protein